MPKLAVQLVVIDIWLVWNSQTWFYQLGYWYFCSIWNNIEAVNVIFISRQIIDPLPLPILVAVRLRYSKSLTLVYSILVAERVLFFVPRGLRLHSNTNAKRHIRCCIFCPRSVKGCVNKVVLWLIVRYMKNYSVRRWKLPNNSQILRPIRWKIKFYKRTFEVHNPTFIFRDSSAEHCLNTAWN